MPAISRPLMVHILLGLGSCLLALGTFTRLLPFDWLETLGFISGAWGVWLQVRESWWNWPIQLISSALYVYVFLHARLYSDASLNVLYVGLYIAGWYWWVRGGERHRGLVINRTVPAIFVMLAAFTVVATIGWTWFLRSINDSAPLLDAFTTVLSLAALFMTARKLYESWWIWIVVNLVFVGLYLSRHLELTAILYLIFAVLSVAGLLNWRRLLRENATAVAA